MLLCDECMIPMCTAYIYKIFFLLFRAANLMLAIIAISFWKMRMKDLDVLEIRINAATFLARLGRCVWSWIDIVWVCVDW